MIRIKIDEDVIDGRLMHRLNLEGHANYAPEGQDIVCAAVSIIVCTLANRLDDLQPDDLHILLEPGDTDISCVINDYAVRACFDFAEDALGLLSLEYPDYIY